MNDFISIVGMEIHVELKTVSKMFCGCKNDPFHAPKPNIYTCPVCLGLPGALPVPNKKAVEWTIKLGLAVGSEIQPFSKFDRKNYFYPDLVKGYQISQYDKPLCLSGVLKTSFGDVRLTRIHLEEDTGKLLHKTVAGKKVTLVDFNRSGVPLVEIVTEPDIHSSEQAVEFLKKLHQIVRYLDISDADMEKGSMRLEPNISVQEIPKSKIKNPKLPNYKVEVKNINSFKFVKRAIEYETKRQGEMLERGETPTQETRGWNEEKATTLPQRRKEGAADYRYFSEPDIPPMRFTPDHITKIKQEIGELPDYKLIKFIKDFALPVSDAERLVETKDRAEYFEEIVKLYQKSSAKNQGVSVKSLANWLLNKKLDISTLKPEELLKQISVAKTVITFTEDEFVKIIEKVINENPKPVADYKSGKTGAIMFLVGQTMRELKGKGDARQVRSLLEELLLKK